LSLFVAVMVCGRHCRTQCYCGCDRK